MDLLVAINSVPLAQADMTPPAGTPQYATSGNPGASPPVPPTQIPAYHYNHVVSEIINVIKAGGLTPSSENLDQLLTAIQRMFRTRVYGGTLNLYVSTTGSDSNTGTTAQTPFLTINAALAYAAQNYDFANASLQINLAAGSYSGFTVDGHALPIPVSIVGNLTAPSTVTIAGVNTNGVYAINGGSASIYGVNITATGSGSTGGICLAAQGGSIGIGPGIILGSASGSHIAAQVAGFVGFVGGASGYAIVGGAQNHWFTASSGIINTTGGSLTLSGTPNFSEAFATCGGGNIQVSGMVFNGAATGSRYIAANYGVIYTNGAGANYLPGNSAGSTDNGLYQ